MSSGKNSVKRSSKTSSMQREARLTRRLGVISLLACARRKWRSKLSKVCRIALQCAKSRRKSLSQQCGRAWQNLTLEKAFHTTTSNASLSRGLQDNLSREATKDISQPRSGWISDTKIFPVPRGTAEMLPDKILFRRPFGTRIELGRVPGTMCRANLHCRFATHFL
jgi:hypothetical protein